jgi:hypothetical protein
MTSRRLTAVLASGVAVLAAVPAGAQTNEQKKAITESLEQRIKRVRGSVIDPQTAGYYQLVVKADGFARDALCPTNDRERDALLRAGTDIFNWALRKKKNWGATASIFYSRSNPDLDDPTVKPDATIKFFTVEQKGADPKKCNPTMTDVGTLYSPLLPIEEGANPAPAHIELVTWFNDQSDQARIDLVPKLAGAMFGAVGLPPTLLDAAGSMLGTTPAQEIKELVDSERTSKARTRVYPRNAEEMGAIAHLGLREPNPAAPLTMKAQASFSFQPVSSIFSSNQSSFVSLASKGADEILNLNLAPEGTPRYLRQELGTNENYNQMLSATTYDVLNSRCESLYLHLRDTLKLSAVDSAVIVRAVAAKHPSLKELGQLTCLTGRAAHLAKVSITIPAVAPVRDETETGAPAKQARMKAVMNSFAALRATDPQYLSEIQWGAFRFPLTVYDAADKFGWDNQRREFSVATQGELHQLLRERVKSVGCWAYFEDLPVTFATGMGDVGAGNSSPVRKSAALALLADKSVSVIQFRYGGGAEAMVTSLAFVPRDAAAKEKMLSNESCKPGNPDREWMQAFLRPPAANGGARP